MSYRDRPGGYDPLKWAEDDTQRRRRRASTKWLLLFGIAVLIAWAVIVVLPGKAHGLPNVGLLMPTIIAAGMSPFARAPWLTKKGRARYDEFERAAYARATAMAFAVFLLIVTAVFAWIAIATARDLPRPSDARGWIAWGAVLLLIGTALPLLFAEFIVPHPPAAEEWEA